MKTMTPPAVSTMICQARSRHRVLQIPSTSILKQYTTATHTFMPTTCKCTPTCRYLSSTTIIKHQYPKPHQQAASQPQSPQLDDDDSWPQRPPIQKSNVYHHFIQAVGNTSLLYLRGPSEVTGCHIYGKAEYENPGGSIKDRAAMGIIKAAEKDGILRYREAGLIVEGTAGNTGIGLALLGNSRGYRTIIVIADTQSDGKKNLLRWCGAELLEVPAVPFKNPNNYVHVAERLSNVMKDEYNQGKRQEKVLYADQWGNLANRQAHIETTGPEIWEQLDGRIDAFSCATGTGGTLSGVAEYMRSKNTNIVIGLTDPQGAGLVHYFNTGMKELKASGDSVSEGIGQNRITGNMAYGNFKPDVALEIPDTIALPVMNDLLQHEGLVLGSSTAINVAGSIELVKKLGWQNSGKTLVTILADYGTRYSNKIYNPQFLRTRSLPIPSWLDDKSEEKKQFRADLETRLKQAMVDNKS
jgi:cysteine synthase A